MLEMRSAFPCSRSVAPIPGAWRGAKLLLLHAGDFDRLRPQRDVGGNLGCELVRTVSERIDAIAGKPLGDLRILHGAGDLGCDPVDDVPGRAGGGQETVPGHYLESRVAGF